MQRRVFARPHLSALSPLARSYSSNTVISGGTPSGYEAVKARLNALEPTEQSDESRQLAVDTSGLHRFKAHEHRDSDNPLTKHLLSTIRLRGPITLATFMREALRNPEFGYYVRSTVLGREGDFVTSPEISQMFGEMIGVWVCDSWRKLGSPQEVNIIELGPGKGTLLADTLRVLKMLTPSRNCNFRAHLVEVSPVLRSQQAQTLGCNLEQAKLGNATQSSTVVPGIYGIPFQWHNELAQVPTGNFVVIAHEFFDALAVHQFQYTENGWRELLVELNDTGDDMFKIGLAPGPTPASTLLTRREFLKHGHSPSAGDILEVCAEGMAVVEQIASRMTADEGAALILDYGGNFPYGRPTIRGIRNHVRQSIFQNIGEVDISVDVDFDALKRTAISRGAACYGPIAQQAFLRGMGIDARLASLLSRHHADPEQTNGLCKSYERLIDPEPNMGMAYKVLAIFPPSLPSPEPFERNTLAK